MIKVCTVLMDVDAEHSETLRRPSQEGAASPLAQAATVVVAYLDNTRQANKNQAFSVLYELATATAARARDGRPTDFTAANLKQGVAPDTQKDPSGWLSPSWSKLIDLEPQWQEGLVDAARRLGLRFIPKLDKQPGSPAHYQLLAVPLPPNEGRVAEFLPDVPEGGVCYTPAAVAAPAGWLGAALKSGVVRWTTKLRWTLVLTIVLGTLVGLLLLWLMFSVGLKQTRPLSLSDLLGFLVAAAATAWVIQLYRFLDDLFTFRIIMAPDALTPLTQTNVTLEVRRASADDTVGELAFVRYSAICPLCDGAIDVESGRKAFPDRLVGRCRRSGREHVFSFDHVLRVGRRLQA